MGDRTRGGGTVSGARQGALVVVAPGLSTTVQDRGRVGWQRFGVPVSGALDADALAAANIVAGNTAGEAGLECLYQGCELQIDAESARVAVAGAGASLDILDAGWALSRNVPALESVTLVAGQRARVKMPGPSISAYLAIEGGFALPAVMGSLSTYVRAAIGGLGGRRLRARDALPLAMGAASARGDKRLLDIALAPATTARVVLGPQDDHFTAAAIARLTSEAFLVLPESDRMGLRLGGSKLEHIRGADIVSDGIAPGAIQVPGDGLPIVMLADRQTTGGYTKIATVISADLPALGRVGPGAVLRLVVVDVETAEALAQQRAVEIDSWAGRLVEAGGIADRFALLYDVNLISGVVDGDDTMSLR